MFQTNIMQTVALCFSPIIAICCSVFKLFGTLSSNQVIGVVLGGWGDHIGQVSPSSWGGQGVQTRVFNVVRGSTWMNTNLTLLVQLNLGASV